MNRGLGLILVNFGAACYLIATGILGLTGRTFFPNSEIRLAVTSLFSGNLAEALITIFGVLAIAAGAFILLKFFGVKIPFAELALIALAVFWIVLIVMLDVVRPINASNVNFVDWLRGFSSHVLVLAGILLATERFGG